jgi:hypothetical protein
MEAAPTQPVTRRRLLTSRRRLRGELREPRLAQEQIAKLKGSSSPAARLALQQHGAMIAVDMERGIYIKPGAGEPWSGGYSRTEISRAMGYDSVGTLPAWIAGPDFVRMVEYERLRRDAAYRLEMIAMMPVIKAGSSALLMEVTRRAFVEPEKIPHNVLFAETRKFIDIVAKFGTDQPKDHDVQTQINNFFVKVENLPEEGREAATEIMRQELRRITGLTSVTSGNGHSTKIVEVDPEPL